MLCGPSFLWRERKRSRPFLLAARRGSRPYPSALVLPCQQPLDGLFELLAEPQENLQGLFGGRLPSRAAAQEPAGPEKLLCGFSLPLAGEETLWPSYFLPVSNQSMLTSNSVLRLASTLAGGAIRPRSHFESCRRSQQFHHYVVGERHQTDEPVTRVEHHGTRSPPARCHPPPPLQHRVSIQRTETRTAGDVEEAFLNKPT